jgi:hypothetical protein
VIWLQQVQPQQVLLLELTIFQNGTHLETGLMFVNVYHVLVNLLRLQHMRTVMVCLHIISKKVITGQSGNIWTGDGLTKVSMAFFFDEKADEEQRVALNMIFGGKAGGFMGEFAKLIEV